MQLSRTARFLIAALLLAAAAFVWVNFFNQGELEDAPTLAGSQQPGGAINVGGTPDGQAAVNTPAADGAQVSQANASGAGSTPAAVNGQPTSVDGQPTAVDAQPTSAAEGVAGSAPNGEQAAPASEAGAPPVVVASGDQVVTRDLVVEQLPFLVLGPPSSAAGDASAADAAGASRPQASQRASINPFSPVVVQAPPAAAPQQEVAQAEQPPASPPIVEVQADGQPPASSSAAGQAPASQAQAEPVRAPAPRTVAPAGVVASNLPRALPSGTLPATPQILRDARSQPVVVEPVAPALGDLAALREPTPEAAEVAPVDTSVATPTAATVPDPLGPGRPLSQPVQAETPSNTLPLAVGADPLSRYLRDNDVRFTGTVLGPLSVGIFRANQYSAPVILTLGQELPDTDIILSDLRGYEARFTQGDRTQTLSLDLRR